MIKLSISQVFIITAVFYLTPIFLIDILFVSEIDLVNYLSNKIPNDNLDQAINSLKQTRWISHLLTLVFIFLKTVIVASIIGLGVYFMNYSLSFIQLWKVTLLSQLIFSMKGYWLLFLCFNTEDFVFERLQSFNPLSLETLLAPEYLENYISFAIQSITLFEIAYWFLLAFLLSKILKIKLNEGLKITFSSYVPAFGLWLLAVTFFLVSNS